MKCKSILVSMMISSVLLSCSDSGTNTLNDMKTETNDMAAEDGFEDTMDGKLTHLYTLKNQAGIEASITNYGGRLVSLMVPNKEGNKRDVVVGFKTVKDFVNSTEPYFGATIGRYGNRIAKGEFSLDGKEYTLFPNNGPNTLHGGKKVFRPWFGMQKK